MTDPFTGVRLRLDRAEQHILDLEALVADFHRTKPYRIVVEDDPESGQRIVKLGSHPPPIPPSIAVVIGDAVHSMRSSLDYLVYAAVRKPNVNTAFPVWRKANRPGSRELRALVSGKVRGASQQLRQALCALEPYEGGNGEYVWVIDRLDLIDKHRLLVTIGMAYHSFVFDAAAELRGLPIEHRTCHLYRSAFDQRRGTRFSTAHHCSAPRPSSLNATKISSSASA